MILNDQSVTEKRQQIYFKTCPLNYCT